MLENDLEIWHEFVELTRQQMDLYENYADYKLSFASESSYLKDNGRVKELPNYPECVTYTVTYTTGSTVSYGGLTWYVLGDTGASKGSYLKLVLNIIVSLSLGFLFPPKEKLARL